MYRLAATTRFKKDLKILSKRGYDLEALVSVIDLLAAGERLPGKFKEHILIGNYTKCHECHISPDWLLIYEIDEKESLIYLIRTGTHSDLF